MIIGTHMKMMPIMIMIMSDDDGDHHRLSCAR
jgi:hypothetical protein